MELPLRSVWRAGEPEASSGVRPPLVGAGSSRLVSPWGWVGTLGDVKMSTGTR